MKRLLVSILLGFGIVVAVPALAQAPASAPAGTTGQCKDGSWTTGAAKKGACRGHKGVKEWYGAAVSATAAGSAASDTAAPAKQSRASRHASTDNGAAAAARPADATGQCKDGSWTTGAAKKGACRGHKGVREWFGAAAGTGATATTSSTSAGATGVPPTPKPADATGQCNDGTWYTGATKKGACRGHRGVKEWFGPANPVPTPANAPAPMPASPAPRPAPPTPVPGAPSSSPATAPHAGMPAALNPANRTQAAGGGAGKVWLNTESKVYHCQNDEWYGKTKQGEYVSESDAVDRGAHAAHGKSCSK
jgi:uncharacterized protein DUF3761